MASIGDWIKRLDSAKAAAAFIILVGSLVCTSVGAIWTNLGIPTRVGALEEATEALGQTTAEHIRKEEAATEWITCSVREMFDYFASDQENPINPMACVPDGGES